MDIELVTDKICMMYIVSPLAVQIVAASSLQLVISGKADISAARVPSTCSLPTRCIELVDHSISAICCSLSQLTVVSSSSLAIFLVYRPQLYIHAHLNAKDILTFVITDVTNNMTEKNPGLIHKMAKL